MSSSFASENKVFDNSGIQILELQWVSESFLCSSNISGSCDDDYNKRPQNVFNQGYNAEKYAKADSFAYNLDIRGKNTYD